MLKLEQNIEGYAPEDTKPARLSLHGQRMVAGQSTLDFCLSFAVLQISVAATMGHFLSEFLVQRCFLVGGKFQGLVSSEYYSVNTLC